MKFLNHDLDVSKRIDSLPLPRVGVNYRAGLQRSFPRRFFSKSGESLWIGEDMDESRMNYLFWFRVGFDKDQLTIEMRYDPSQCTYEISSKLCNALRSELVKTVDTLWSQVSVETNTRGAAS